MNVIEEWEALEIAANRSQRIESLLHAMFEADKEYGSGFYNSDKWNAAYNALAKECGVDLGGL